MNQLNYWRLYAKIFNIKICRKCGERLPEDYHPKRIGYICDKCKNESQ